ncbi:MAG: cytochrome c [Acidimicrobiia bacterium]|nr:cytochrome c [Acidimicrobiia bacterium]
MKRMRMLAVGLVAVLGLALAACGGGDDDGGNGGADGGNGGGAGDVAAGEDVFMNTCAACHGTDAEGLPGSGKALKDNTFIQDSSDEDLVGFIEVGRGPTTRRTPPGWPCRPRAATRRSTPRTSRTSSPTCGRSSSTSGASGRPPAGRPGASSRVRSPEGS